MELEIKSKIEDKGKYIAFLRWDRDTFIEQLNKILGDTSLLDKLNEKHYLVGASLVCGCFKTYKDISEIPSENDMCKHNNYYIKYLDKNIKSN